MERFASPEAPLTFVFPETRNPSVIGDKDLDDGRVCLRPGQRIFVNIGRFYCAEYDQDN